MELTWNLISQSVQPWVKLELETDVPEISRKQWFITLHTRQLPHWKKQIDVRM